MVLYVMTISMNVHFGVGVPDGRLIYSSPGIAFSPQNLCVDGHQFAVTHYVNNAQILRIFSLVKTIILLKKNNFLTDTITPYLAHHLPYDTKALQVAM